MTIHNKTRVVAILVNWKQPYRTLEAVNSVKSQTCMAEVVVVDNGSSDDSASILSANLPQDVTFLKCEENLGFGSGVNKGMEYALSVGADYVWLINNDAVANDTCLQSMIDVAFTSDAIGVVGAKIVDPTGCVPAHAGTLMNPFFMHCRYSTNSNELNSFKYSWITGACMLLNMSAIKSIGFFDSEFFMYWEDADLCMRIKRAGYQLGVASKAIVTHKAGTSSDSIRLQRFAWHIDSQILWVTKNYRMKFWGWLMIFVRHILKSLFAKDWERFGYTLKIYFVNISK